METYLKPLQAKINTLLPVNSYFTLDDSEQSHVVYPTNHVNLYNDFISIEVATVIYDNINEHEKIINSLSELFTSLSILSEDLGEYCAVCPVGKTIRLIVGGLDSEQKSYDFYDITSLLKFINNYHNSPLTSNETSITI